MIWVRVSCPSRIPPVSAPAGGGSEMTADGFHSGGDATEHSELRRADVPELAEAGRVL